MSTMYSSTLSLLLLLVASPFPPQSGDEVHIGIPPEELRISRDSGKLVLSDRTRAHVGIDTDKREVLIHWRRFANAQYPFVGQPDVTALERRSVSFWPTCATPIGEGRLAVAGKKRNGDTIIEVWTFRLPRLMQTLEGLVMLPQSLESKELVYEESSASRDMVMGIFPNPNDVDRFFVQYFSSRDVYDLFWNLDNPTQSLVFDVELFPPLLDDWDYAFWSTHSGRGHMIVLHDSGFQKVLLRDADMDGVLDEVRAADTGYIAALPSGSIVTQNNVAIQE